MPTTNVIDLNVIALYVTDLARSQAFYADHLGFEKVQNMDPGILMKAGKAVLYLEAGRKTDRTEFRSVAEFRPCFATESVKGSYIALKEAGVSIATHYQEHGPSFALFRIADPDGNLIEFAGTP